MTMAAFLGKISPGELHMAQDKYFKLTASK